MSRPERGDYIAGRRPERSYVGRFPTRGYITVTVMARSVAEAEQRINENHPSIESNGEEIVWSGRAQDVRLDRVRDVKPDPPFIGFRPEPGGRE